MSGAGRILGIDPGRSKVGYAVVDRGGTALASGITTLERLHVALAELLTAYPVEAIALGRGTNGRPIRTALGALGPPVYWVDEYETSRAARALFFEEHPPRGWRRLVPRGLQVPNRPIDDYAAILIARRFLARGDVPLPPS